MHKEIRGNTAYFTLYWSKQHKYDRYNVMRVLPELPGIINLQTINEKNKIEDLIYFICWRDGLRLGLAKLLDPMRTKVRGFPQAVNTSNLLYRYCEVNTNMMDMKDILHFLIRAYKPAFNARGFPDSGRYKNIFVQEDYLGDEDVVEKVPRFRKY